MIGCLPGVLLRALRVICSRAIDQQCYTSQVCEGGLRGFRGSAGCISGISTSGSSATVVQKSTDPLRIAAVSR
jgi:hypothetical protein